MRKKGLLSKNAVRGKRRRGGRSEDRFGVLSFVGNYKGQKCVLYRRHWKAGQGPQKQQLSCCACLVALHNGTRPSPGRSLIGPTASRPSSAPRCVRFYGAPCRRPLGDEAEPRRRCCSCLQSGGERSERLIFVEIKQESGGRLWHPTQCLWAPVGVP